MAEQGWKSLKMKGFGFDSIKSLLFAIDRNPNQTWKGNVQGFVIKKSRDNLASGAALMMSLGSGLSPSFSSSVLCVS